LKLYTLAETIELLPRVVPVVESLRAAFVALRDIQTTFAAHSRGASGDGHLLADPFDDGDGSNRIDELNRQLQRAAAQLDRWGIEIKDPERGLIDFFHERDGRTVYLCYLLGEANIEFWHELSAGFAGRQRL
jgi:hypothetical protein